MEVIVTAPVNIALVKYWGKCDHLNMHPTNNSVSVTLCQRQLNTTTRIISDSSMTACSLKLNGKFQHEIPGRILDVIIIAQLRARLLNRSVHPYVRIESTNGFPTAAGLASSASGLASLAFGLAQMYGLREDIAGIARRGSGSACRSTYGGFVHWSVSMGAAGTPISSVVSLYPASYWPTLKVLVCLTNDQPKSISSTCAMERTVLTSKLYQRGRRESAIEAEKDLLTAFRTKSFPLFADVTMRESNQLHAVCFDTWPPCWFLNSVSLEIIRWVHYFNEALGRTSVAYTFDAGPNAFLFAEEADVPCILHFLVLCFGKKVLQDHTGSACVTAAEPNGDTKTLDFDGLSYPAYSGPVNMSLLSKLPRYGGGIMRVISTEVGDGPQLLHSSAAQS